MEQVIEQKFVFQGAINDASLDGFEAAFGSVKGGGGVVYFEVPSVVLVGGIFERDEAGLWLVKASVLALPEVRVSSSQWLAFSDDELVRLALVDAKLFRALLVGDWVFRGGKVAEDLVHDGKFSMGDKAWRGVRQRVASKRGKWVAEWGARTGLELLEGDGLIERYFNAELLDFYARRMRDHGVDLALEPSLTGKSAGGVRSGKKGATSGVVFGATSGVTSGVTLGASVDAQGGAQRGAQRGVLGGTSGGVVCAPVVSFEGVQVGVSDGAPEGAQSGAQGGAPDVIFGGVVGGAPEGATVGSGGAPGGSSVVASVTPLVGGKDVLLGVFPLRVPVLPAGRLFTGEVVVGRPVYGMMRGAFEGVLVSVGCLGFSRYLSGLFVRWMGGLGRRNFPVELAPGEPAKWGNVDWRFYERVLKFCAKLGVKRGAYDVVELKLRPSFSARLPDSVMRELPKAMRARLDGYLVDVGRVFEWAYGLSFVGSEQLGYAKVVERVGDGIFDLMAAEAKAGKAPGVVFGAVCKWVFESVGYQLVEGSDWAFNNHVLDGFVSVGELRKTVIKLYELSGNDVREAMRFEGAEGEDSGGSGGEVVGPVVGSFEVSEGMVTRVVAALEDVVLEYAKLVHLTPDLRLGFTSDAVFGKRIGVLGDSEFFWKATERKASESLGILLGQKVVSGVARKVEFEPMVWGEYGDKRSFVDRVKDAKGNDFGGLMGDASRGDYGSDVDLERVAKVARYDAFGAMGEPWARGIILMEGAMRSYLKNIGFSFDSGEGSFWRELGVFGDYSVPKGEFPVWRWLLLREAYLAAYVWAWGQFLYGGWSGFSGTAMDRYRRVLASYSSGLGAMTRKVNVPYWEGKPVAMNTGCSFTAYIGVVFDWRVLGSFYDFAEPVFLVDDRLAGFNYGGMKYEALGGKDIVPVFGVGEYERKVGGKRVMQGKFDEVEVGGKKAWRVGYTDTGYPMVGVDTPDLGSAAQTVGLLFLAGNNRYQMLKHGTALAAWVKSKGLPEGGLYGWAPFGLHDTKRWVEGRGISYLFDDSPLVHAGEAMLLPGFEGWLGLPWKERLGGWMMTERAGLSYPLSRKSMDGTTKQWSVGEHLAGFLWFDRVVRAVGRGLDPTLLRPLGDVDYIPSGDRATFLRWRQRIWGHYFSGLGDLTKLAHKEWGAKEDGVLPAVSLVKPVGDLWRAWQRPWLPKV